MQNISMDNKYDCLKLENQICFPLYAASNIIIKRYKTFLDDLSLTYTQYIVMMVLWEHKSINVKKLGEYLFLDSGTLTPLLKKLEIKGYLKRERSMKDERNLNIVLTEDGERLRDQACKVPEMICREFSLSESESTTLYMLLYKLIKGN